MCIKLYPDQQIAYDTILNRYDKGSFNRIQLLPASLGWGKSFCAAKLAQTLYTEHGVKIMIICPPALRIQWKELFYTHNIPIDHIYSYNEIRGKRGKVIGIDEDGNNVRKEATVNNKLLTRGNKKTGPFETTNEFDNLCKKGLFIIFDESQSLKNQNSSTHWAAFALIKTAMEYNKTKIIHLSASVIDKDENWQSFFRIMGLITIKKLRGKKKELWKDSGIGTLYEKSKEENVDFTEYAFNLYTNRNQQLRIGTAELFKIIWVNIFKQSMMINVKDVVHMNKGVKIINHIQNGFYKLDDKGVIDANEAIKILKYNGGNGSGISQYQPALMKLASSKNNTVIRLTLSDLRKYPTCKIILCIGFKKDQDYLHESLKEYGVLLLNSNTSFRKRIDMIDEFNEPNLNKRIIITSSQIGGTGINLHDIHGDYPRRTYIVPTFHFLSMFQVTGRTYRRDVKSNVFVSFVYGNNTAIESVFVNTMMKSKITKSLLGIGERQFPDTYKNYIECMNNCLYVKSPLSMKLLNDINNNILGDVRDHDIKQFSMYKLRLVYSILNKTVLCSDSINNIIEML